MSKRKLRVLLGTSLLFFGNGLLGAAGPTFRSLEPEVIACDFGRSSSMFPKTGSQEPTWSGVDSPFQCRVLKQEMTVPTGFDTAQPLGPWHDGRTLFLPPSLAYEVTYRLGHAAGRNEVELLALKTWLYDEAGNLVEINYPEDFPGLNLNDYLRRGGVTATPIPDDVDWMPRDIETLAANLRQPLRAEEPAPVASRNSLLNNAHFTPIRLTSPEMSIEKIDIQLDLEKSEIHVGDTIRVAEWETGSGVTDAVVEEKIERKLDGAKFSVSAKNGGAMEAFAPGSWEIRHLYQGDFAYAIYVGSQNIIDGSHSGDLSGLTNASKIYLVPSANYAAGTALDSDTMKVSFADNAGAIHYTSDQSGSPLAINTNSKHYLGNNDGSGLPVLAANTVTWKNKTININLGANPTVDGRPLIWSETNAAFGQNATPEQEQAGILPYRDSVDDTFVSPNITLTGTAELRGTKAIELVAMKGEFNGDYSSGGNAAGRAAGEEAEADFGKITVGGGVVLDGGVLQQLFAHGFQGNFASNRNNSFGGIDLQSGSTVKGSVIVDGSIRADGTVKLESTNRIEASNIAGKIESRNEDSVGFCASLAGWFDASKIDSSGAGATLQIDGVTITGEIGNGTADQPSASYTAVLLDGACHNTSTTPSDGGSMGATAKIQSGVKQVNILSGAKIVAAVTASGDLGTGVAVHTDDPAKITINGGSGTPNSIKAAGIGVLVDADRKGTTLKLANTSIESTSQRKEAAAIVARNTAIEIGDDVTLKGSICGIDSDAATTYTYRDGATSVKEVHLPKKSIDGGMSESWDAADLKTAQLDLDVKLSEGKEFRMADSVYVTNFTQGASCRGTVSCEASLDVGQSLDVSGGSFRAAALNWHGEPGAATPDHLRLNAQSMDGLTVDSIFADQVRVAGGGDAVEKCPEIEVCGKDPTVRYVGVTTPTGAYTGIEGNNEAGDKDYEKYIQLKLTGAGGTIGSATKLGEIRIETENDQGIWTIEGETSCARLTIGKGKLHQLGKLTIWGDMLLLGCDIDWQDSVFNGGIYAPEDTIFARAGSKALIRNGFASSDESLIDDLQYVSDRLNGEGILLDGTARFLVDESARAVNFQIVGVSSKDSSPVAIRVAKSRPDAAQVDNSNSIELNRSLNIQYYGRDGKIYCGTPTAIWGTRQTVLNLNRGTREDPNFFRGSVRNVGRIEVNGNWRLLDGLRDCGHLRITRNGFLDVGRSMLDVRTLSIFVDPKRTDAYLTCAGFLRDTVLEMRFDESILLNPHAQSYLLVDGLTDVASTQAKIHQLNIGGFSFTGEGENLYLTFAADDNVTVNNPRRIYYLGGYLREDDDAVDGESSEERQYNEMRRKEAARATDGSTNSEDNEDLFHSTNLRQLALREGEPADAGLPSDPSDNAGNPSNPAGDGGSVDGDAPGIASWSLQQAEIVGQQINQVRQLLLTHDFDPMHGSDNYVAYIQPFGGFSKRKEISADLKEVKADRYGILLGAQKYLQGGIFVQGAIGYGWTDDSFEQGEFSRDCKTESILVAAEAAYRFENLNVRLVGTFGSDKYKYDRLIDGQVLHSEYDGYSAGGALQADYLLPFHGFLVGPVAEVSYDYVRQDGYRSETGDLEVGKFSARNGKVRLGVRFEQQTAGQMPYCVYGTASWVKAPYRRGLTSTMKVGSGGNVVQADDVFLSREAFEGRLGVRLQLVSGWNLDGFYNVVNQKHFIDHAFSVQFGRQF